MSHKHLHGLGPTHKYVLHLLRNILIGTFIIALALFIGMLGYHYCENLAWIDAFVNAAMILSGMGPLSPITTYAGKLFAGFYALFSGLAFVMIIAIIFSPAVHRFLRKVHLESQCDEN